MLHNKIVSQPEVASGMDQHISEQVENKNYIKVNRDEACCANFQLHFVGYNFVVSATSSSTKVRMTTDLSMRQRQVSASMTSHYLQQEMLPTSRYFDALQASCVLRSV